MVINLRAPWDSPNVRFGSKADICLPPKADMCGALAHVRFVPKADIASLIDDFVGASDQGRRHGEPERFCGLEVDR